MPSCVLPSRSCGPRRFRPVPRPCSSRDPAPPGNGRGTPVATIRAPPPMETRSGLSGTAATARRIRVDRRLLTSEDLERALRKRCGRPSTPCTSKRAASTCSITFGRAPRDRPSLRTAPDYGGRGRRRGEVVGRALDACDQWWCPHPRRRRAGSRQSAALERLRAPLRPWPRRGHDAGRELRRPRIRGGRGRAPGRGRGHAGGGHRQRAPRTALAPPPGPGAGALGDRQGDRRGSRPHRGLRDDRARRLTPVRR